tara:strand:- start:1235 stop:1669 length:435 start_codon:yes stop_codon:yes gene_type:complete
MKIINPLLATSTLSILPRETYSEDPVGDYSERVIDDSGITESVECVSVVKAYETVLVFNNKDTNEVTYVIPNSVNMVSNQMVITFSGVSFNEGDRYTFKVYKESNEIFRDTLLATQYNETNYTVNNNEFVVDIDTDSDSIKVYE